jgi:FMN phosphatase YigB (HAD superfamily)
MLKEHFMVKVVLFDLGDTLEHNDIIRQDTIETLEKIKNMENHPILGLASDYGLPNNWGPLPLEEQIKRSRQQYFNEIEQLGIRQYFEPQNVILSTDVGNTKDQDIEKFFQKAVEKIGNTSFNQIIFITENCKHIDSANSLGIKTIFLKLNNNSAINNGNNTISNLIESINLIQGMIND